MTTLRFQEELMRVPIGKFDYFVLNRRAVPWSSAFNAARVKRRSVKVGSDNLVRARGRPSGPARHLFHVELSFAVVIQRKEIIRVACRLRVKTERRGRFISMLNFAPREVNRTAN